MLIKRKKEDSVDEIVVNNAAEIILLWEVGRLQQIHGDCFKGALKSALEADDKGWGIALELIHGLRTEWSRHAELLAHYVKEYRDKFDDRLPSDLGELSCYLKDVELDRNAIVAGKAVHHDEVLAHLACLAGLRKAEIAVSVADSALSVLRQPPRKWFLDLKVQVEMLLAERLSERMRLEESLRDSMVRGHVTRRESALRLRAVCTTRHDVPCAVWRSSRPDT